MTEPDQTTSAVDRRLLLRGGAVLAGAAGATVLGAAMAPSAQAADNDTAKVGALNTSTSSTTYSITSGANPTLRLNNAGGPSLSLQPLAADFFDSTTLPLGGVGNTELGPYIGVDYGNGAENTFLATGFDLDSQPATTAFTPVRMLDTRTSAGRANVVRTSSGAFDSSFRLKTAAWLDIALLSTSDAWLDAVFLNLTVAKPTANGYLTVYPPGDRPTPSSINFSTGQNLSNASFVGVGQFSGEWVVRIYASKTTHVVCDLNGWVISPPRTDPVAAAAANRAAARRQARHEKLVKGLRSVE